MNPSTLSPGTIASVSPFADSASNEVPQLGLDEVVVWQASLDGPSPASVAYFQSLLSDDEKDRAACFFFDRDRNRFVVGRGLLRLIVGHYVGVAPQALAFEYNAHGKPELTTETEGASLHFNLAHSGDLALFAFTRVGPIGVDVERMRDLPDWPRIAELSFSPQELARVNATDPADRPLEFFRAWTRQEAVLKAYGVGLGAPACDDGTFVVHELEPAVGHAAAVAVGREACTLVTQSWLAGAEPGQFHAAERSTRQWLNSYFPQRG